MLYFLPINVTWHIATLSSCNNYKIPSIFILHCCTLLIGFLVQKMTYCSLVTYLTLFSTFFKFKISKHYNVIIHYLSSVKFYHEIRKWTLEAPALTKFYHGCNINMDQHIKDLENIQVSEVAMDLVEEPAYGRYTKVDQSQLSANGVLRAKSVDW